jgi:hypothetical protein
MGINPSKGKAPFFYLLLCPYEFTQKKLHYQQSPGSAGELIEFDNFGNIRKPPGCEPLKV